MQNITLTEEQILSIVDNLSSESRQELKEQILFKEWLDSPEGQNLLKERESDFTNGRVLTMEQMREKLGLRDE